MPSAEIPKSPGFAVGTHLFLRVLAVTHAIAFISAWTQLDGLVGPAGILPAQALFEAAKAQLGAGAYWAVPSLSWIFGTGVFLKVMCALGVACSGLLFAGVAPALALLALWALYLSVCCAGQQFFDFQWDALLLETTVVALFLVPWTFLPRWRRIEPPALGRWLAGWLLFRLMFLSGMVKIGTGDPQWRHLTALKFHFQTQPLPSPLAWYAHQLPGWVLIGACGLMFAIEIVAPFGLFAGRRVRHVCVLTMAAFQLLIALTGNYTFFNLLTLALCLPFLDDAWWRRPSSAEAADPFAWPRFKQGLQRSLAVGIVGITGLETIAAFIPAIVASGPVLELVSGVAPLRSFNTYGLFAVMTTSRPELIIEGSDDARDWKAYELPYKPGNLSRMPAFIEPFQPRLDWQLWFAALGNATDNRWVYVLGEQLLKGDPQVLALFSGNPFPGRPPKYLRVVRYEYRFADSSVHARTGQWWSRSPIDLYIPPFSLSS
jgi:hypothetical protein